MEQNELVLQFHVCCCWYGCAVCEESSIVRIYPNNEGVGFFPGQASLAYFFFLGSSGSSNRGSAAVLPGGIDNDAAAVVSTGGAMSISGAGLGSGIPSLDDNEVANNPDGPAIK